MRGRKTDVLLSAMYVTDRETEATLTPIPTVGCGTVGARLADVCAVFATDDTLTEQPIAFRLEGDGELTYYISGVAAGKWSVSINGKRLATFEVKDGEGLLTFSAPAGDVLIEKE
jgi:hypothetical protein